MSWLGTMIGEPLAGCRMLLVDIISTRASSWLSSDSGTCTAIWSPSKSALKAAQRRRAIQQHRMLPDHLVENVPHLGLFFFDELLGLLDGGRQALGVEAR